MLGVFSCRQEEDIIGDIPEITSKVTGIVSNANTETPINGANISVFPQIGTEPYNSTESGQDGEFEMEFKVKENEVPAKIRLEVFLEGFFLYEKVLDFDLEMTDNPVLEVAEPVVEKEIGISGGSIETESGNFRISFPPEAIKENTLIRIIPLGASIRAPFGKYRLEPSPMNFERPVMLEFRSAEIPEGLALARFSGGEVVPLRTSQKDGTVLRSATRTFSDYGPMVFDEGCEDISCGQGEICYFGTCYPYDECTVFCEEGDSECLWRSCPGGLCEDVVCPIGFSCYHGVCMELCSGEDDCSPGSFCYQNGLCLDEDTACNSVICPIDQVCYGGECYEICADSECSDGTCFDEEMQFYCTDQNLCDSVICPIGHTCLGGVCFELCKDENCQDVLCVNVEERYYCGTDNLCDEVFCGIGQECFQGKCYDICLDENCQEVLCVNVEENAYCGIDNLCEEVYCPPGFMCYNGGCFEICKDENCEDVLCMDLELEYYCGEDWLCENVFCPIGQQCVGGNCYEPCAIGSPDCSDPNSECYLNGFCYDREDPCKDVICPLNQICFFGGTCWEPCTDTCSDPNQVCIDGICFDPVDPCNRVNCKVGETCVDGKCERDDADQRFCSNDFDCEDGDVCLTNSCENFSQCFDGEIFDASGTTASEDEGRMRGRWVGYTLNNCYGQFMDLQVQLNLSHDQETNQITGTFVEFMATDTGSGRLNATIFDQSSQIFTTSWDLRVNNRLENFQLTDCRPVFADPKNRLRCDYNSTLWGAAIRLELRRK